MGARSLLQFLYYRLLLLLLLPVQGQRRAEQKCREYQADVVVRKGLVPLTLSSKPIVFHVNNCGTAIDLIVGGENVRPNEFPHQALLGWPSKESNGFLFLCGGSLISDRFVLSAAHCLYHRDLGKPTVVRLGENNLNDDYDDQVDFDIEQLIKHPQYKVRLAYFDIALVKLTKAVLFSRVIRPICLWTANGLNYTLAVATGFGKTETAGESAPILQKVRLAFVSQDKCNQLLSGLRKFPTGLSDSQYCMASPNGEVEDTCQGDSGGPIQVLTDTKGCIYHQVAVTSTGLSCGAQDGANVYTRISSYVDWIEEMVWR